VAEELLERISSEFDKQVDTRLAQRGIQPALQLGRAAWANLAVGLGSVGLGIGATAVILQSWPTSGAALTAVLDLGSFRASLMTSTKSVNAVQVVLIALIWPSLRSSTSPTPAAIQVGPELRHHAATGLSKLTGRPAARDHQFRPCFARAWEDAGTDEKP
jgi:hypothetical protein